MAGHKVEGNSGEEGLGQIDRRKIVDVLSSLGLSIGALNNRNRLSGWNLGGLRRIAPNQGLSRQV